MDHNILAMELCLRLEPGSRVRAELRDLVKEHPEVSTPGLKWNLIQRVSHVLISHQHLFERGCWDFFDDDERALKDHEMWANGMITEEGARKEPSGPPGPNETRYLTFTVSLLLAADTECARDLANLCDIPEADLWKKESFLRILRGFPRVNFAAVKSDVLYLIPRDEEWGLTAKDLEHEKFEYLRPIV